MILCKSNIIGKLQLFSIFSIISDNIILKKSLTSLFLNKLFKNLLHFELLFKNPSKCLIKNFVIKINNSSSILLDDKIFS